VHLNRLVLILLFAASFALQSAHAEEGDYGRGAAAYATGNYADAFIYLEPLAKQGDDHALYLLGEMYRKGLGLIKDPALAMKLLGESAQAGNVQAQISLGEMYDQGEAGKPDPDEALKWMRAAADQGHPAAQLYMGLRDLEDDNILNTHYEAVEWFRKAAEQNEPQAQYFLGRMIYEGQGTPMDEKEGLEWLKKAAAQKNLSAMRFLYVLSFATDDNKGELLVEVKQQLSSDTMTLDAVSDEPDYGYKPENPIKTDGVINELRYLNSLLGPNGEVVLYHRKRSCCPFKTKHSPDGIGFIDEYELTYDGLEKPVILYLNRYLNKPMKAPLGFTYIKTE
jgi:TPR repeat protein